MGGAAPTDTGSILCAGALRLTRSHLPAPLPQERPHLVLLRWAQPRRHLEDVESVDRVGQQMLFTPAAFQVTHYSGEKSKIKENITIELSCHVLYSLHVTGAVEFSPQLCALLVMPRGRAH